MTGIVNHLPDFQVDLSQTLVVVVTICTAAMYGLVILHRPDRAAVAWGGAFGLGLLGTYVWVAAIQMDLTALRALASGLMLCAEPLIWLGLRFFVGRRAPWPPVVMFVALVPTVLTLTADSEAFPTFLRFCFAGAGVFAGLIAVDLVRMHAVSRDILLPLLLASGAFVILAALNVLWPLVMPQLDLLNQVTVLRDVNGIGTLVTSLCATLTILLLVRSQRTSGDARRAEVDTTIRERVARAAEHQDPGWSLLDVRLDDTADLREASGPAGFSQLVDGFHAHVLAALPPSADVATLADNRILVLLPGSDEAVEHHLRSVLDRVSGVDAGAHSGAIRVSASVGWATMLDARFDYDRLLTLAAERAEGAGLQGGDRWERTRTGTVTMAVKTI